MISNSLVINAGTTLPAFVTKTTVNHLNALKERQWYNPTS